ncbi:MAG: DEAD/DEAH box helicase [Enhydrobacter sp.]|nr:DEAD/DEAH box helicase [Enhydrobacter sp.]
MPVAPRTLPRSRTAARRFEFHAGADPIGALAVALLPVIERQGGKPLLFVAQSDRRAEALAAILAALSPDLRIARLPAWDNLPYDRTPPSRAAMGQRAGVLRWLTDTASPPAIVLTTPMAAIQRVPPRGIWAAAHAEFRVGEQIDLEAMERQLTGLGYTFDERVDVPGEAALRGRVVDLYPAAAPMPCRIEHEDGRIVAIRSYDPLTQRSDVETDVLWVDPASEFIATAGGDAPASADSSDATLVLSEFYNRLETLFDYLPDAPIVLDNAAAERAAAAFELIAEAYDSRKTLRLGSQPAPVKPDRVYLTREDWEGHVRRRLAATVQPPAEEARVPRFVRDRQARRSAADFVARQCALGARVVLCGSTERDRRRLVNGLERALETRAEPAADWAAVAGSEPGALATMLLPVGTGFHLHDEKIVAIAAADVFGGGDGVAAGRADGIASIFDGGEFQPGDAVVHIEHGMAILEGLEEVPIGPQKTAETLQLRYAKDARLKVPIDEIGKVWRYGAGTAKVTLDHLKGDSWSRRRAEVEAEIERTAVRMLELARARNETPAEKLVPPTREMERFAAGFGYSLTPDQATAVEAVLADLASGRPMDRLVCGDVGFGKTEVALRAVAAAVLAGKQAVVIAPTTVLVRQHLRTFQRRFARFGIEVAHLSRLVGAAEARAVKKGLASGEVRLVVGTHALAGKGVRFHDLGLMVIDEEQRFGARDKARLRAQTEGVHVLTLTATPIPRTLQSTLVGLQDLSVIATPPVRRQPIRTVVAPFDAAVIRDLLMREQRRGGQSFFVCPRIEDMEPMAARLREIVPELHMVTAHGQMPTEAMDEAMVGFADGEGDLLLATNIIESGLDVPRANTMLVWRADRFGLAQLHQLRGRVGRGARRGVAYLLTDPEDKIAPATAKRLRALEDLDRLGAGFDISARDLDMRGAGDLLGEHQAGHIKLIGAGLYRHLLERAVAQLRGESCEDAPPAVNLGDEGRIPEEYVPGDEVRIGLYARLEALQDADEIAALEDEVRDRFGPPPAPVTHLFQRAKLRKLCREAALTKLEVGDKAIAATPRFPPPPETVASLEAHGVGIRWSEHRFILPHDGAPLAERASIASKLLELLAKAGLPNS